MGIYTLTLSAAFDIYCDAPTLAVGQENIANIKYRCAGGKGINISRALSEYGIESDAIMLLGEDNAQDFLGMIYAPYINIRKIGVMGRIRENFTFRTDCGVETRISFNSPPVPESTLATLECELATLTDGDVLTVTGRVPEGIDVRALVDILIALRGRGVRLVIDSRSFTLDDILAIRPFLIKPNEEELSLYLECDVKDMKSVAAAASELSRRGVECVMVTLGSRGALVAKEGVAYYTPTPSITPVSTVGAGDAAIAGFLVAYTRGEGISDALRLAASFGTAACLTRGTDAPTREKIDEIYATLPQAERVL